VAFPATDPIWGFDSELIDPALKHLSTAGLPDTLTSLASDPATLSLNFVPASHSTPIKPLHDTTLSAVLVSSSSAQALVIETPPTGPSSAITCVPSLGEHPIHHLHKVLHNFKSAFPNEGVICTINTLLNLPPPSLTKFYRGEYATSDGKCPFCGASLQ